MALKYIRQSRAERTIPLVQFSFPHRRPQQTTMSRTNRAPDTKTTDDYTVNAPTCISKNYIHDMRICVLSLSLCLSLPRTTSLHARKLGAQHRMPRKNGQRPSRSLNQTRRKGFPLMRACITRCNNQITRQHNRKSQKKRKRQRWVSYLTILHPQIPFVAHFKYKEK